MNDYTISLLTLFDDIRVFIYGGIRSLPLTIAGFFLIFGIMTANYAMMIFLFAFMLIVPVIAYILTKLIDFTTLSTNKYTGKYFKAGESDLCPLILPFKDNNLEPVETREVTAFTTSWLSMMVFFLSYMLTNATFLHNLEPASPVTVQSQKLISNRKSQAMLSIILTVLLSIVVLIYRYSSGCENIVGILSTIIIFGFFGYSWYNVISQLGQNRLSDLFGISNRMLTPQSLYGTGVACFPVASS